MVISRRTGPVVPFKVMVADPRQHSRPMRGSSTPRTGSRATSCISRQRPRGSRYQYYRLTLPLRRPAGNDYPAWMTARSWSGSGPLASRQFFSLLKRICKVLSRGKDLCRPCQGDVRRPKLGTWSTPAWQVRNGYAAPAGIRFGNGATVAPFSGRSFRGHLGPAPSHNRIVVTRHGRHRRFRTLEWQHDRLDPGGSSSGLR